jgi:DNA mismatch repair protein MutS2
MAVPAPGTHVQTPLGKGIVRQVRRGGQIVVEIGARVAILSADVVAPITGPLARKARALPPESAHDLHGGSELAGAAVEIDLHGLFVPDALARVEEAVNDAILDGRAQLRLIHGRSGGRIRAAVHRQLRSIASVRRFRLDPANPGVTLVEL